MNCWWWLEEIGKFPEMEESLGKRQDGDQAGQPAKGGGGRGGREHIKRTYLNPAFVFVKPRKIET